MSDSPIVTVTVDGPRASGVTRIADLIQNYLTQFYQQGVNFPDIVVKDMSKERDGNVG